MTGNKTNDGTRTDGAPSPERDQGDPRNAGRKDSALPENDKAELDERLDEAVEETFPASDPVSVKITK